MNGGFLSDSSYLLAYPVLDEDGYNRSEMSVPNSKWSHTNLTYKINEKCSDVQTSSIDLAFYYIEQNTSLNFLEVPIISSSDITLDCPSPLDNGMLGLSLIIPYPRLHDVIIYKSYIWFYGEHKVCPDKIAMHEILHSLGFDHNKNDKSILYSYAGDECDRMEVNQYFYDELNEVYRNG